MGSGIGIKVGGFVRRGRKAYKPNKKGMREMMRTQQMQGALIHAAQGIADRLNSGGNVAHYDVGPVDEYVYSEIGAHAFVRTANQAARIDQAMWDTLGEAVGG